MSDCRKCAKFEECAVDEDCGLFVDKPMTNADRIRTMTDEELAEWIANEKNCSWNDGFYGSEDVSENDLLAWLKSPVEVDNGT